MRRCWPMPHLTIFSYQLTVFDAAAAFEVALEHPGAVHKTVYTVESIAESVHRNGGQQRGFGAFGSIKLPSQYGHGGSKGRSDLAAAGSRAIASKRTSIRAVRAASAMPSLLTQQQRPGWPASNTQPSCNDIMRRTSDPDD
jgi:hypothetical protein